MASEELNQQGVLQLRAEDLIMIKQNGREKYLMVIAVVDAIRAAIKSSIVSVNAWFGPGAMISNPMRFSGAGNTSGGTVVFNTVDANGDAIFNTIHSIAIDVNDSSANYATSWAFSADMKTLTVTVRVAVLSLGILNLAAAANGKAVRVTVFGV